MIKAAIIDIASRKLACSRLTGAVSIYRGGSGKRIGL
jgi:hypothetical protein